MLAMYTKEPNEERKATPFIVYAVAVTAIVLNIALGIFPSFVLDLLA
jgi:NADH-quinone oxidoreductase subunit N